MNDAEIAQKLADSRAAHGAYRLALRYHQHEDAKIHLSRAALLRKEADLLDPDHAAPAWTDDAKTHPHDQLLAYYDDILSR